MFPQKVPTPPSVNRRDCIKHISNKTRPQNNTHSIITGDFNFVDSMEDRWNLNKGKFSGTNNDNSHDARAMHDFLCVRHGFHEWDQPFMTCDVGGARSRIDRMYTNQHVSYQLDHNCNCNALEWDFSISRHRAISFARRSPNPRCDKDRPLDPSIFKLPCWPDFVTRDFRARCEQDPLPPSPNRQLVIRKDSIRECHANLVAKEKGSWENNSSLYPVSYTHLTLPTSDLV